MVAFIPLAEPIIVTNRVTCVIHSVGFVFDKGVEEDRHSMVKLCADFSVKSA